MNIVNFIILALAISQPATNNYKFEPNTRYDYPAVRVTANKNGNSDTVISVDCYKRRHCLYFLNGAVYHHIENINGRWEPRERMNPVGTKATSATMICRQDSIAVDFTSLDGNDEVICRRSKAVDNIWGFVRVISPMKGRK